MNALLLALLIYIYYVASRATGTVLILIGLKFMDVEEDVASNLFDTIWYPIYGDVIIASIAVAVIVAFVIVIFAAKDFPEAEE